MDELQSEHVLFETLRVRRQCAEYVEEHLARLAQSIAALGFQVTTEISAEEVQSFAKKNAQSDKVYRLRIFATQSGAQMKLEEYEPLPAVAYREGVALQRVPHPNLLRAPHKFWQRPAFHQLLQVAQGRGYEDVLLCNETEVLETATSNFIIVEHGKVFIPPKSQRLPGIMEQSILQKCNLPVVEQKISWPLPPQANCYITSSLKGLVPVAQIDHSVFPLNSSCALYQMIPCFAAN